MSNTRTTEQLAAAAKSFEADMERLQTTEPNYEFQHGVNVTLKRCQKFMREMGFIK